MPCINANIASNQPPPISRLLCRINQRTTNQLIHVIQRSTVIMPLARLCQLAAGCTGWAGGLISHALIDSGWLAWLYTEK